MPPKRKSVEVTYPPVCERPWTADAPLPDTAASLLADYVPCGVVRKDILQQSLLLGIPPHPGLIPRRADAPAEPPAGDAPPDHSATFDLTSPAADSFQLVGWEVDAGSWVALMTALKACTALVSLRFSHCNLSIERVQEVQALAVACSSLRHVAVDYNPLPAPPAGPSAGDDAGGGGSKLAEGDADASGEASGAGAGAGASGGGKADGDEDAEGKGVEDEDTPPSVPDVWASFLAVPHITALSLRGNDLSEQDLTALGSALRANTTLQSLVLAMNNMGDAGLRAFLPGLRRCRTLQKLSLAANNLTSASAVALASALTTYELSEEEFSAAYPDVDPDAPPPREPEPEPSTRKGKGGKPPRAPVPASGAAGDSNTPLLVGGLRQQADGRWRGLGWFGLQALDLVANQLGDDGVQALVQVLFPRCGTAPSTTRTGSVRGSGRRSTARSKRGGGDGGPDELWAQGNLPQPVRCGLTLLCLGGNRASADVLQRIVDEHGIPAPRPPTPVEEETADGGGDTADSGPATSSRTEGVASGRKSDVDGGASAAGGPPGSGSQVTIRC